MGKDFKVNVDQIFEKEFDKSQILDLDIVKIPGSSNEFHMLYKGQSYTMSLRKEDHVSGKYSISVNGYEHHLTINDKWSELLSSMGLDKKASKQLKELKAPMPGLIRDLFHKAGDSVQEGDTLVLMEAMKMENQLKSPAELVVKSIEVKAGDVVEKGQLLIRFEE